MLAGLAVDFLLVQLVILIYIAVLNLFCVHNKQSGYTWKIYGGHLSVPTLQPIQGYHGENGFRRNTPQLRWKNSVFDCDGKS